MIWSFLFFFPATFLLGFALHLLLSSLDFSFLFSVDGLFCFLHDTSGCLFLFYRNHNDNSNDHDKRHNTENPQHLFTTTSSTTSLTTSFLPSFLLGFFPSACWAFFCTLSSFRCGFTFLLLLSSWMGMA